MEAEMKPCRFCGNENCVVDGTSLYHVTCLKCEAHGPLEYTKEDAVEAWNRAWESFKEATE
jgi:Lar family restriction alleviation protein